MTRSINTVVPHRIKRRLLTTAAMAMVMLQAAALCADGLYETGGRPPVDPVVDADSYDDGRPSADKVELGRKLFFDKILSGNRNISCATCHHPSLGCESAPNFDPTQIQRSRVK